jgi:xanthine/uracil permease
VRFLFRSAVAGAFVVMIDILIGFVAAIPLGLVDLGNIRSAGWAQVPTPFAIGSSSCRRRCWGSR